METFDHELWMSLKFVRIGRHNNNHSNLTKHCQRFSFEKPYNKWMSILNMRKNLIEEKKPIPISKSSHLAYENSIPGS